MRRAPLAQALVAAGLLAWCSPASAEVTSWLSVAGGASRLSLSGGGTPLKFQLPFDIGVGLPPSMPVIVGVGVKLLPYLVEGVDYAAYLRVATRNYALGGFGAALDAGAYGRSFDGKSGGLLGVLNLGVPWGGIVSVNYGRDGDGRQTVGATVGIDFLRLTVYRLAGEEQWPNVRPAWRP